MVFGFFSKDHNMCALSINPVFVKQMTFFIFFYLFFSQVKHGHSKLVWCSLVGKVLSYYRNQEDKVITPWLAAISCFSCCCFCLDFSTYSSACLWVPVASGAAADARGPGAGSGPLLRLGRGLRGRKSGLPVVPLHLGGAAQGAEPHLPADRHQAGEGAGLVHLSCQVWLVG